MPSWNESLGGTKEERKRRNVACVDAVNCDQKAVADCLSIEGYSSVSSPMFCFPLTPGLRHASQVLSHGVPAPGPMLF